MLCDLYIQRKYRIIISEHSKRRAITAIPKKLIEAIYGIGADGQKRYQVLGLERGTKGGALDALTSVLIKRDSHWIDSNGKPRRVIEAFHLIDGYRYHRVGNKEYLQVFLSEQLQQELRALDDAEQWTIIPSELIRNLGPKRQQALRVALHVLSHSPLPSRAGLGSRREIGATALVGVVRSDQSRDPKLHPGKFMGLLQRIIDTVNQSDPDHNWELEKAVTDPLGKVVCTEIARKQGNMTR